MALYDEVELSVLDRKARQVFGDQVVPKSLAQEASLQRLPRYVAEYLIAKYVKPETWRADLANIQRKIKDLLPDLERRELLKDRLLSRGEITVIDNLEVRVDLQSGQRWGRVPAINDDRVRVPAALTEQSIGLLLGGMWGTARIRFTPEKNEGAPNELVSFTPFQVGPPDVESYKRSRVEFTTDEWIQLMLRSAGYSPQVVSNRRHQLLLLARLIPLVERNVNLVELGPRQTGKTFLLRNLSPRTFVVSGGKATPANLFYNLAHRTIGILGTRKVVIFDEIAHTSFDTQDATLSTLKDYMESGNFSRGNKAFAADASIVFSGNMDVDGDEPDQHYRHLFQPFPRALIDSAFIDRINGYHPGWEVPKITPASLAKGVGFVSDYFGEVLHCLREDDFRSLARTRDFAAGMTQRDAVAVEKLTSGLVKLIHPHGDPSGEEFEEVLAFACELRQRVHNQLCEIAPGEFQPRFIGFDGLTEHAAQDLRNPSKKTLPKDDRLNHDPVVGAVTGLAVLLDGEVQIGGDIMIIQVSAFPGTPGLEVTGLHGRVLRDSVQTAYNIVRSRFRELGVPELRLRDQRVAVHLVRIAEPREGPSAGLAFVAGIVSALTGMPIRPGTAMTGEVSLHGEVTGVGGIAHKLQAAVKAGRTRVLIPAENGRDVAKVPDSILSKIEVVPVRQIEEALELVLEGQSPA